MYKKKLSKIYAGCALALTLAMVVTPVSAFAAETETPSTEVNTVDPGDENKASDPTKRAGIDPTAQDNPATAEVEPAYSNTDIDVWGHTKAGIVYSVDVEWGAMTFQYELSSWNPTTHTAADGRGWVVYDNTKDMVLGDVQDAINRVAITNHSNAEVFAQLSYAGVTDVENSKDYTTTTGTFANSAKADTENVKAAWDGTKNCFTLQTAATDTNNAAVAEGTAGTPSKGNVYFKPDGISDTNKTADGIAKWSKIGKITVKILTEAPAAAEQPAP